MALPDTPSLVTAWRIKTVHAQGVAFAARADDKGGKRLVRPGGVEFVRRFLLHVLPTGLKRIRHYGVLASACKGEKLALARAALAMPAPNPSELESATQFLRRIKRIETAQCPQCKVGTLRVVQTLAGQRRLAAPPSAAPRAVCRGPP